MSLRFIHMTGPSNQLPTYLPRQTRWTLAAPSGPSAGAPPPSSRPCMGPAQSRPALPPPTARINVSLVVLFSPWQPLSAGKHGGPGLFLSHVGAPPCRMQMHLGDRRRESLRSAASPTLGILNTKAPGALGPSIPSAPYMTLSSLAWAYFLLPGCSCLSVLLSYPALRSLPHWLVCPFASHSLVFFLSSPLIDNSTHSHLQSCCALSLFDKPVNLLPRHLCPSRSFCWKKKTRRC